MGFVTSAPMCNNGTQGKFTSPWCFFGQLFGLFSAICPKMGRLSIQAGEESEIFLGIRRKSPYLCIDETVNNKYKHLIIKIMTTKNFNAKKMLMSTVAAVVTHSYSPPVQTQVHLLEEPQPISVISKPISAISVLLIRSKNRSRRRKTIQIKVL